MQIVSSNHGWYFGQYERTYPTDFYDGPGYAETHTPLADDVSQGTLGEICFAGVRIHYGQLVTNRADLIQTTEDFSSLTMRFQLRGQTMEPAADAPDLNAGRHNLICRPPAERQTRLAVGPHHYVSIQLTESFFNRLADVTSPTLGRLQNSLIRREVAVLSNRNLPIGPALRAQLARLSESEPHQPLKRLYLELLVLDLLRQQLEQADAPIQHPTTLKPADAEKVWAVKERLEANPLGDYSLLQLARWAGLNDFKLKRGFRELFGTTVFGYLTDLRMNYARQLLLDGGRTVGEVADALGYRETHHFSTAFKRKFGLSPSQSRS